MRRKFISLTLSAVLALGVTTPAWAATETYADGEVHTIGVVVYDPDASEMEMFSDYYRDYIQAGFPVKFIFSGKTTSAEDEIQYIDKMKEQAQKESFLSADLLQEFRISLRNVKRKRCIMHLVPTLSAMRIMKQ